MKSLNFGIRCKSSCNCAAGWIRVFRRGDVYGVHKKKVSKVQRQLEPEEKNVIPRKRSRADADDSPENGGANSDLPEGVPPTKKAATGGGGPRPFSLKTPRLQAVAAAGRSAAPVRVPPTAHVATMSSYRVVYDASQPLGFYCEARVVAGKRVCIVTSVCPSGQSRQKSPLVQEGTWSKPRNLRKLQGHVQVELYSLSLSFRLIFCVFS